MVNMSPWEVQVKMPQGFEIVIPPLVEVEGRTLSQEPEVHNLGDGYQVKDVLDYLEQISKEYSLLTGRGNLL